MCIRDRLSEVRNREIGFIFQGFNLISNLTAIENVELPLVYRGVDRKTRHKLAVESLTMVGLETVSYTHLADMAILQIKYDFRGLP